VPGAKPPVSIESEDASLPTAEGEGRRAAAAAADGVARPVGACEIELNGSPHEGQNRARSGTSDEHAGQWINPRESYPSARILFLSGRIPANCPHGTLVLW
jgi:hypothetical protein